MIGCGRVAGPLLRCLGPEAAHWLALRALAGGLVASPGRGDDPPQLAVQLWKRTFPNPIGLAAGFDKNAEAADALLKLGFGFVEVGGVTPRPQPGSAPPRVFRLPKDRAIINRIGFKSDGVDAMEKRLRARGCQRSGIVGVNLGKNKDSKDAAGDYEIGARRLAPWANFLVINVSSPNTPGLRALQSKKPLVEIVRRVRAALPPQHAVPVLLKIAPDVSEEEEMSIATVALEEHVDGLVVSNTTVARPQSLQSRHRHESGGLSGAPLMAPSTALLARMYQATEGRIPLIGVGGVASGDDAYLKIRQGASLVQLYSALVYEGPRLVHRIKTELAALLKRDRLVSVAEAVGADFRK